MRLRKPQTGLQATGCFSRLPIRDAAGDTAAGRAKLLQITFQLSRSDFVQRSFIGRRRNRLSF